MQGSVGNTWAFAVVHGCTAAASKLRGMGHQVVVQHSHSIITMCVPDAEPQLQLSTYSTTGSKVCAV